MFGPIPKKYWSSKYKVDENNMCIMAMRCLFIETEKRRIVVDTGLGDKHNSQLKFYQPFDLKDIREEIRKIGYEPEEVTDVVNTHLHFDHCGGNTIFNDVGKLVPTYPNATYHISMKQWNNYRNPTLFEKGSFFSDNIEPIQEAQQLAFITENTHLDEQIKLELYDGHSPGQIVLLFNTEERNYAFPGDVVPTSLNLSLSWLSGYDNSVAVAMDEKKRFLDRAKADQRMVIFYHDAYISLGKL